MIHRLRGTVSSMGTRSQLRGARRLVLGLVLLGAAALPALADVVYNVTEICVLPGENSSGAFDINSTGQVAGYCGNRAIFWDGSALTDIGALTGSSISTAWGINFSGMLAGSRSATPSGNRGFTWDASRGLRSLEFRDGWTSSDAFELNDSGIIIGHRDAADGRRAVIWDAASGVFMMQLDPLTGDTGTDAFDINSWGVAAGYSSGVNGWRATTWSGGVPTELSPLSGGDDCWADGLNELGQIAGTSNQTAGQYDYRAVMWDNGVVVDLGALPGGVEHYAYDINDSGQIVGTSYDAQYEGTAFYWDAASGMVALNDLIDPALGWSLVTASAINNLGMIVGEGVLDGQARGYVLTRSAEECPEPGTIAMFLLGGAWLAWIRKRKTCLPHNPASLR